jgi:hypothetical protein
MTVKIIHTATAPDGTTLNRTSASRRYSHAVLGKNHKGAWIMVGCSGRLDLAHNLAAGAADRIVVPLEVVEKAVTAKPKAEYPGNVFDAGGLRFSVVELQHAHHKAGEVDRRVRATFGDWIVELHKYSADFGASAWREVGGGVDWRSRVHTKGKSPNLENVVERIKAAIAAKTAELEAAA